MTQTSEQTLDTPLPDGWARNADGSLLLLREPDGASSTQLRARVALDAAQRDDGLLDRLARVGADAAHGEQRDEAPLAELVELLLGRRRERAVRTHRRRLRR